LLQVRGELERANEKLVNPTFVGKAPPAVIEGVRERKAVLEKQVGTLEAYLKELMG
jgi:valyl-tRNA synthetase